MSKQDPTLTRSVRPSADELSAQEVRDLPDREAMSLVNANVAAPINLALAANVLSDGSVAYANAEQYAPVAQGIGSSAVPPSA